MSLCLKKRLFCKNISELLRYYSFFQKKITAPFCYYLFYPPRSKKRKKSFRSVMKITGSFDKITSKSLVRVVWKVSGHLARCSVAWSVTVTIFSPSDSIPESLRSPLTRSRNREKKWQLLECTGTRDSLRLQVEFSGTKFGNKSQNQSLASNYYNAVINCWNYKNCFRQIWVNWHSYSWKSTILN